MNTSPRRFLPTAPAAALLSLVAVLALAACGSETADNGNGDGTNDGSGSGDSQPVGTEGVIAELRIVVSHPDREADLEYTVGCLGDTFPVTPEVAGVDGEAGCAKLADDALRSRLIDGPPADMMCTQQYGGPDQAVISGTIDGQPVDATITRVDGCEIETWEALVGLLPPAIGVID
jgi:hypothetical protein